MGIARRRRLCYVIPTYDRNSPEHFFHVYRFLAYLARDLDLFVVVERGVSTFELPAPSRVYTQRWGFPVRIIEAFGVLLWARIVGYRTFYIHYSYIGAVLASVIARATGGVVYYWNCGLAKMFFRPWSLSRDTLRAKLTAELPLRLSLALADHLVTGTPGMAAYYDREFRVPQARTIVLPNEIDLERFREAVDRDAARQFLGCSGREVVLFVHRLSPRKGARHLPEIVRRVRAQRPNSLFIIAGDGPSRSEVENEIASSGLSDHARFLGWVPNQEVRRLYAAADVYVMPSDEEGFPRVLLEAMACGVPIVATDVGGVAEILPDAQLPWLARVGDVGDIAQKVVDLLGKDAERAALASAGRDHVRRYDLPVVAEMFVRLIVGEGQA